MKLLRKRRAKVLRIGLFVSLIWAYGLAAGNAETPLADPVLEARAQAIFPEIRCVVCQGQSIADSNAELASEMRAIIREQLATGRTRPEVLDFLRTRYGDFVLFRPPFSGRTLLLWGGPFFALGLGVIIAIRYYRRMAQWQDPDQDIESGETSLSTDMLLSTDKELSTEERPSVEAQDGSANPLSLERRRS